jgi:hypothetical protein
MEMDFAPDGYYVREVSLARNLSKDSGMANYLWGDPREPDQPGKGFFVLGAWDAKVSDVVGFGRELVRAIRDPNVENVTDPHSKYVVTCKIDTRRSFEYRQVTLAVQGGETGESKDGDDSGVLTNRINYNRILYGGDKCNPVDESISFLHAVAAFTVHYKLALENFGLDGFFETVHRMAGGNRGLPYAFNNSRNGLEDALGVASAIGVSTMVVHEESGAVADAVDKKAIAVIVVRQLGYGNLIVLLGASTGRDGIGGASVLASATFTHDETSDRGPAGASPVRADRARSTLREPLPVPTGRTECHTRGRSFVSCSVKAMGRSL